MSKKRLSLKKKRGGNADLLVGKLLVYVSKCRNLTNFVKPLCKVRLDKVSFSTQASKEPKNPVFGDSFTFDINKQLLKGTSLIELDVEVWDEKNAFKRDKRTGVHLTINLCSLMQAWVPMRDSWWLLENVDDGEIHIQLSFASLSDVIVPYGDTEGAANHKSRLDDSMHDRWGFLVPPEYRQQRLSLRSYHEIREQRQIVRWENSGGLDIIARGNVQSNIANNQNLFWSGVPEHYRKDVYLKLRGHKDRKDGVFERLRQRAKNQDDLNSKMVRQIEVDLPRTFPGHETYINKPAGQKDLRNILRCVALYNPVVRYCQGMNLLAGFLLCKFREEVAFWILVCLSERIAPGYYVAGMEGLLGDIHVLRILIKELQPELDTKMDTLNLPLEAVMSGPLLSMYVGMLPSDTVSRLFDCVFLFGTKVFIALCLLLLELGKDKLLKAEDHVSFQRVLKQQMTEQFDADLLMDQILHQLKAADHKIRDGREAWQQQCEANQTRKLLRHERVIKAWGTAINESVLKVLKKQFLRYVPNNAHILDYQRVDKKDFKRLFLDLCRSRANFAGASSLDIFSSGVLDEHEFNVLFEYFSAGKERKDHEEPWITLRDFVVGMPPFQKHAKIGTDVKLRFCHNAGIQLQRLRHGSDCGSRVQPVHTLKWLWLCFFLERSQLLLIRQLLESSDTPSKGRGLLYTEFSASIRASPLFAGMDAERNSVRVHCNYTEFDVTFGPGSMGIMLKSCREDQLRPIAALDCWVMVKWIKPSDKANHNRLRVRPGTYIIGINGDTSLLGKPLSEVKRIISQQQRPLILTMRNYFTRDVERKLSAVHLISLKYREKFLLITKMRAFMLMKHFPLR